MVFFTPSYKKNNWSSWRTGIAACLLCVASPVLANGFTIMHAETYLENKVHLLNADMSLQFSDESLEALRSGVPLIILVKIKVEQKRSWYWFDKTVAELEQGYLLLYHALTEKFIIHNLNSGAQQNFASLSAAMAALGHVRDLPVIDHNLLDKKHRYDASIRVMLDIESLPAPMRPIAYISSQWQLESDWYTWSLTH